MFLKRGVYVEVATVAWVLIEGAVALGSGIIAHSLSLVALVVGIAFLLLAVHILGVAIHELWTRTGDEFSVLGLGLAAVSNLRFVSGQRGELAAGFCSYLEFWSNTQDSGPGVSPSLSGTYRHRCFRLYHNDFHSKYWTVAAPAGEGEVCSNTEKSAQHHRDRTYIYQSIEFPALLGC